MEVLNSITNNSLLVLGAGVDVSLGLPTMNNLMSELVKFSLNEGKLIDKILRENVKGIRFNLQKRAGEQGEQFGEILLSADINMMNQIKNVLMKSDKQENQTTKAMLDVIERLAIIHESNSINNQTYQVLSTIAGETGYQDDSDYLINLRGLALSPIPRQAIRKMFLSLSQINELSSEEKEAIQKMICIVSNFEELLGELFSGFFTKNISNQKKYYYLSWLFWSYLRYAQVNSMENRNKSFYFTLNKLEICNIITFNYTNFYFSNFEKVSYFHGNSMEYIRFDTRELIKKDDNISNIQTVDDIVKFLKILGEGINWETDPPSIWLPAIIPPLSMKPVICNEYLDIWTSAGTKIKQADKIIIIGYSFNVADEHFNDLLRKCNLSAPIYVINPDVNQVKPLICKVLGIDKNNLTKFNNQGVECWKCGRLSIIKARAEELSVEYLKAMIK